VPITDIIDNDIVNPITEKSAETRREFTKIVPLPVRLGAALRWAAAGWRVFPCIPNSNLPLIEDNLALATTDPKQISEWWTEHPNANIGSIPPAGIAVADLDVKHGGQGPGQWVELVGEQPETFTVTTPSGGKHLYYEGDFPTTNQKLAANVDTRGCDGKGYLILPPSVVNGKPYVASDPYPPEAYLLAPLPELSIPERTAAEPNKELAATNQQHALAGIAAIPNDDLGWDQWNNIGMAIWSATKASEAGLAAWLQFSAKSEKYDEGDAEARWEHYSESPPNSIGAGTLFHLAEEAGWKRPQQTSKEKWGPLIENMKAAGLLTDSEPAETAFKQACGLRIVSGDDVEIEKIIWLWPGHYACGKVHLRAGAPDTGKNATAIDTAAILSRGGTWPDGTQAPVGDSLIWSSEDSFKDITLPRYLAAGGVRGRLYTIDGIYSADGTKRYFDPSIDVPELCRVIEAKPDLRYIIIDPISVVVGTGHGASHNDAESRRALQPLVDLAEARGIVVEGIIHFRKGGTGSSKATLMERIIGATAFGAVARIIHATGKVDGAYRWVRIKGNITKSDRGAIGHAYTLDDAEVPGYSDFGTFPRVTWGAALNGDPEDLLGAAPKPMGRPAVERDAAAAWLTEYLPPFGKPGEDIRDIKAAATAYGHAWRTVEDAKKTLPAIQHKKNLGGAGAGWSWWWDETKEPEIPL